MVDMILTAKLARDYANYVETYEGDVDDISEYSHLGEGAAEVLSKIDESFYLKLREISESDAEFFLAHKSGLNFSGSLLKLSDETAEILSRYEGDLSLDKVLVGDRGKKALKSRKQVQDESEWHAYLTVIDEESVRAYDPESEEMDEARMSGLMYLESPTAARALVTAAAEESPAEGDAPYSHMLGSFNYYSVEALREIAAHKGALAFDWGEKLDVNGERWSDEHFEALGNCSGPISLYCGGLGEEPEEAITAKQLMNFRQQDLTLEYITALTDDCHDSIKGRSGSLSMSNFGNVSPRIAEALSTISQLELGDVSNPESLSKLLGSGSLVENLSLGTKYIDGELGAVLSKYGGHLDLVDVVYLAEDAAGLLGQKPGGLEMPSAYTSIFVEGQGLEALLQHSDSSTWPETDSYDEEGEWKGSKPWAQSINHITEESDVEGVRSVIEMPDRPLITDDALRKVISLGHGELESIRFITDEQAEIISSAKEMVHLGVCRLTDSQIDILLKIRACISLSYLRDVSEGGARKLIGSEKVVELGGGLGVAKQRHAEDESEADNEEFVEEEDNDWNDVYFNYGRLKQRLAAGGVNMGSPSDLLDEMESDIKSKGFPRRAAMIEFLLGEFFLACVEDRDTSEIKEKIDELFWNPEEEE
ncbi:hypothetical protein N9974_00640 [bacterium]|nr:hypothetical protein [bacterium]MDB4681883.1 hypothetical protein [Akkermansiaceae bacterium]MDB4800443.1 hypothetical protein [bacterium]